MSAATSFPNVEPPPLLFGQRSPSPPFSPRSPLPSQTPQSPPPIQMNEPEDVDMTTSAVLPALNHDRQDAAMDMDQPQSEQTLVTSTTQVEQTLSDAQEVEPMDTTPDASPAHVGGESAQVDIISPASPRAVEQLAEPQNDNVAPVVTNTQPEGRADGAPPAVPSDDSDPAVMVQETSQPSPGRGNPAEDRTPDDSSEEDENGQGWHEIIEDTSAPDEQELKEIEETTEHSGIDRKIDMLEFDIVSNANLHR